jgi:hypothetical protein
MTKGILVFAHNNRDIDYAKLALYSARLATEHLKLPVSLVTDTSTIEWMKECGTYDRSTELFDKILTVERPAPTNYRKLNDGKEPSRVLFTNQTRHKSFEITPYDKTLVIDADYLIFSDNLNAYWDLEQDVILAKNVYDLSGQDRFQYLDSYISETGIDLKWATTFMFTKNEKSKIFFETVKNILENNEIFSQIFRYNYMQFRNDIAFSVANHICNGFQEVSNYTLPAITVTLDKDKLVDVSNKSATFLIDDASGSRLGDYFACSVKNTNVHIMNKKSLERLVSRQI